MPLLYKPKSGDTWKIYGTGEIVIKSGIYRKDPDGKSRIYGTLIAAENSELKGRDGATKNDDGKASPCDIPAECKFALDMDMEMAVGRALEVFFTEMQPSLAGGFTGEINYAISRSADRIAAKDLSKKDFDLAGGLLSLSAAVCADSFEAPKARSGGGGGYATKASIKDRSMEGASLIVEILTPETPLNDVFLKLILWHTEHSLALPTPTDFLKSISN